MDTIEKRWQERFGGDKIDRLRESLYAVVNQLDAELPDYLPILGYGLFTIGPDRKHRARDGREPDHASSLPLSALLSKVLLSFALEFERNSEISIAISANVLRIFGEYAEREKGVYVRDLPRLTAVSKEAIAMSLSFLQKRGYAIVKLESPGSRVKALALTSKGWHGRDVYCDLVWAIEERWQARFSKVIVHDLRESLECLVGEPSKQRSPLFHGLEPYPEGWRASIPKPEGLPHYPMVLHRGGFPDGS